MEKWISNIINEIEKLCSTSYEIESLDYESTIFKIWHKKVRDFFEKYKFIQDKYKKRFYKLIFRLPGLDFYDLDENYKDLFRDEDCYKLDIHMTRQIFKELIEELKIHGEEFIIIDKKITPISYIQHNNIKCFLINTPNCNQKIDLKENWVFQAYDYKDQSVEKAIANSINPILANYNLIPKRAKDVKKRRDYMCKICQMIQESNFVIADLSNQNTSVGLELGLAYGIGKEAILIAKKNSKEVSDLKRNEIIFYDVEDISKLQLDFNQVLQDLLKKA